MAHNKRRTTTRPPPSTTHDTGLVPLSCPDCFGVLHFEREGHHYHLLYRCQVGHRYPSAVSSKPRKRNWNGPCGPHLCYSNRWPLPTRICPAK